MEDQAQRVQRVCIYLFFLCMFATPYECTEHGSCVRKMFIQSVTQATRKKIRVPQQESNL